MSETWDRLGRFGKALWSAGTAGRKFTWDVATAPFNDDEQFNGFVKTFETAGRNFVKGVEPLAGYALGGLNEVLESSVGQKTLKPALAWIDEKNREYIREPLTSFALMDKDFKNSGVWDGLNPNNLSDIRTAWDRANKLAENVSFGQAVYGSLQTDFGDQKARDLFEKFDWNNEQQVDEYFAQGSQQFWSGALDASIQIVGDVTIVGGKAVKVAKGASFVTNKLDNINRIKKAIDAVKLVEDGVDTTSKTAKFIDDIVASDALTLAARKEFKNAPGPLVYELGKATDTKTAALIYRAGALKDPNALLELKALRPDIANPLGRSEGELDRFQQWSLENSTREDGMFDMPWEDDALMNEIKLEMDAMQENDKLFARMFALEEIAATPGLDVKFGAGSKTIQAWNKFTAEAKTLKFYDKKATSGTVAAFQPTPWHRMYKIVSTPFGERPAGFVNFNDPDSSREISATIDRAIKNKAMSQETGAKFMEDYLAASTPEAKAKIAFGIERYGFVALANKRGVSLEDASALYDNYWRARDTAFSTFKKNNYAVDIDGSVWKVPFYESQTINGTTMMDFDLMNNILRDHKLLSSDSILKNIGGYSLIAGRNLIDGADVLQSMFKLGTLLRLGYTVRNGAEAQLRIWSSAGAMASMRHLPKGVFNLVYNVGVAPGKRAIDNVFYASKPLTYNQYAKQANEINIKLGNTRTKLNVAESRYNANPNDMDALAEIETLRRLEAEQLEVLDATKAGMSKIESAKTGKKTLATGTQKFRSKYNSVLDESGYELEAALGGKFGPLYRQLASSENSNLNLVDQQAGILSGKLVDTGYGTVTPDMPNYWMEWARTSNNILGNSEVTRMLAQASADGIDSQSAIQMVTKWLRNSDEGRKLRGRLELDAKDSEEYVTIAKQMMDQTLPDVELQGMLARQETISEDLLRAKFADADNLPAVSGHVLENNLNLISAKRARSIVNGLFRFIGSLPEDAWSRHPLFVHIYNQSAQRRIDEFEALNKRALTTKEQGLLMREARNDALRGVKEVLFTIDRKSNLAASALIKFSSPFFSAFENSMKTWAKLAYNRPEIINRANLIFTAPNRAGIATDEFGRPVPPEEATMDDYIWLEIPEGMKKLPFIGKGLSSLDQMGLQKKSLDVVFQGNIGLPVGPYAAIPLSKIVVNQPSLMDSLEWALPYGPERNAATALLPAWVKRQITKAQGQDSTQYANIYSLIWTTEQHKRRDAGLPPATSDEIKEMTDAYWNMRSVANLVLPFAPTFQSPYKFYIDQFNLFKEQYGREAEVEFWRQYGDEFFDFTTSLSRNPTGVGATVSDVANLQKYGDLIEELNGIDPRVIGLVSATGRGDYEFSQAAYQWQLENKITGSSSESYRSAKDPEQAAKDTQTALGWIKYNEVMDKIDEVMVARGLTNLRQNGAEDLAALKKQAIFNIGKDNIDWYMDYKDTDGAKYIKTKMAFNAIINNEKFMADHGNDPTWKSVAMYLQIRDEAEKVLATRKSTNLTAKSNQDIAALLEQAANILKQQDIGFSDIYDRYFAYDPGYDPVISGATK